LKKPSTQVSITKLQSLLDLVLRNPSSVAYADPFKEDVKVEMSSVGLVEQLLRIINVEPTAMTRGGRAAEDLGGRRGEESDGEGLDEGGGERQTYAPSVIGSIIGSITGTLVGGHSTGGGKQLTGWLRGRG